MARRRSAKSAAKSKKDIQLDFGTVSEPQARFLASKTFYTCYGGARGGGKTHIARVKAVGMALNYPGIRILMIRCHYPELEENLVRPILKWVPEEMYSYNGTLHLMRFNNGSEIKFGHYDGDAAENEYQGAQYDCVFIDEATQLSERAFSYLSGCVRGVGNYPRRMYLTCNPGGVGHAWVKRLFIDREYRGVENPEDYAFIPAKVTDNMALLSKDPGYVAMLDNLPTGLREAWRDGSWDVFLGQYFTEWERDVHVCAAFQPPDWWRWYISLDYGLDMLAALLIGVDENGNAWVTREVYEGRDLGEGHDGLIISEAAKRVKELASGVRVYEYLAPPDLWNRRQETGKSVADIFAENGVYLTQTSNDRIDGWLAVKEWLTIREDVDGVRRPRLKIFPNCRNLVRTLPLLQYDEKKPSDVATEPHELTHAPDALRGFCVYWTGKSAGEPPTPRVPRLIEKYKPVSGRRRSV